jgi:hypothetical protein
MEEKMTPEVARKEREQRAKERREARIAHKEKCRAATKNLLESYVRIFYHKVGDYTVAFAMLPLASYREVKVTYTICSPKDQFSRAEARLALSERLPSRYAFYRNLSGSFFRGKRLSRYGYRRLRLASMLDLLQNALLEDHFAPCRLGRQTLRHAQDLGIVIKQLDSEKDVVEQPNTREA